MFACYLPVSGPLLVNNIIECYLSCFEAKFEENTTNIPKIIELNSAINNKYTAQDYKELEIIILKFFHWYIMFPTAAHYVHYYIQGIISSDDLKSNTSLRSLFYDLHDNITTYLDYVVDSKRFHFC